MLDHLIQRAGKAIPVTPLSEKRLPAWAKEQSAQVQNWLRSAEFKAKPGSFCLLPDGRGQPARVLVGIEEGIDRWSLGVLPGALPQGTYRLDDDLADLSGVEATAHAFAWAMGCYRFARYKSETREFARLVWPKAADRAAVERLAKSMALARDLINTPAEDLGPPELAEAAKKVAQEFKAKFSVIVGDDLLKQNYPTIHAVGRAAAKPPRLVDLRWGTAGPKLTLVGKGVCFDSGGLDLKTSGFMLMMKKDMGGAALMLALARAIMDAKLPLQLRLLIPAVENSVSANAFRPWDVIKTRKGITVEVGNTDAEGRLVLCDALAEAENDQPDLIIDAATLTGAARVALGPELPALFSNNDETAEALLRHGKVEGDPLWQLPLWKPYRRMLDSKVADINNVSDGPFAGAVTAALYLAEFVAPTTKWMHIDTYAWIARAQPGRPEGGEALGFRALFAFVSDWVKTANHEPKILTKKPAPRVAPRRASPALARLRRR
ncbi:MAG TPA: leucyl aminopeptidase family protein [Candidatus Binatia bacterium]|nr:leucyl aminopeptidase family protein [Candidatus Binatia bacterium]